MKLFRVIAALLILLSQVTSPLFAADFYWDSDGDDTNNVLDGTGLGGTGLWDNATSLWWPVPAGTDVAWPNATTDTAIFTGPFVAGPPTTNTVTVSAGINLNRVRFNRSGYTLSGGDLTFGGTTPGIYVEAGETATIGTQLSGSAGLVKSGAGSVRLSNILNNYTGTTSIQGGSIIISDPAALGGTGAIKITSGNSTPLNNNAIGFTGGSLVLDGTSAGMAFTRDIDFEGRGPLGDRSSAILSLGNNTLSGTLRSAISPLPLSPTASIRNSRINSANGTLTMSGTLNVGGTAATTFTTLGGINQAGVSNFAFGGLGSLTGTGSIEKAGQGTLFLNSLASNAGFAGTVRVSASATGGQSSVRVTDAQVGGNNVFGGNAGANNLATIDMRGGVLEFRNDGSMNIAKNVFQNNSSTFFTGPGVGGSGVNGTTTLGAFRLASNTTATFNSRNGYGMTFGAWTQENTGNSNTIANNMGGTLLFTGDVWNNGDGSARNLLFSGNGNTRIAGSVTASGTNKSLIKQGNGELIVNGTASTFTGATNIEAGAVRVTDFRSLNNNTLAINLGNAGTTAGNLIIGGTGAGTGTAAGLTTSKPILFNTTTGQSAIYANQTGTNPVVLNGAITSISTGGNYNFGGSNTADNIINVAIPAAGTAGFTKVGAGTWVLNAANLYTGNTNIQNGTLKLRATNTASNVINDTGAIVFSSQGTALTAGGTLEFRGDATGITTETLGALTPTGGAGTVRLLGQGGFAANLTFSSLGATTAASSLNFDTTGANGGVITITGQVATTATALPGSGGSQGHMYINGANFATTTAAGVVEAPTYGAVGNFRDAGPALVAATHNRLTAATASGAATISSLLTNNQTLTLSGNLVVSTGGILQSGGTASIVSDSATSRLIQGGTAGTNVVIRVNGASDVLNLGSVTNPVNISSTTTAGLTKNGAGRLTIFGTNAQTAATTINEGTVTLTGAASRLSATTSALVIRQGAALELNGHANHTTAALDGSGTIRNVGATQAQFQQTGGGTWNGTFQDGAGGGGLRLLKAGGAATWSGVSTYTGSTTITGTGLLTVDTLANGGVASGIGQSTSAAGNLIFAGTTAGLDYRGSIIDTALTLGSRSATTDRLFTLGTTATGAVLSSSVSNNNAVVWSNTGAIVNDTAANAVLTLSGASTGDNTLNPQLVDSSVVGVTLGLTKSGAGQWNLGNSNNTYTGLTTVADGILGLNNSGALSSNSALVLGATTTSGIIQTSGSFARDLAVTPAAGVGTITWGGTTGGGGFAAHASSLSVTLNDGADLTWGSGGFVGTGGVQSLILNSSSALADVTFTNGINLGAAARTVTVNDNGNTGADYASLTGVLSGGGGGILKSGAGILRLGNVNTYTGTTVIENGTLVVSSLSGSTGPGSSSVGAGNVSMNDTNAIVLGNASTTGGILQYVGAGETSDRKIRIRGTTASNQIHADGAGSLILTNVAHDTTETGAKTLFLRGTNTGNNMITSVLANNGAGVLSVQVDGGASWILSGANTYSGNTNATAGALGIGDNAALGTGTLVNNNGNIFAYGADRTITNALSLTANATNGWLGDYSLTFSGTNSFAGDVNLTTSNSLVAGKTLTFQGVVANSLTANRAWGIDGPGETVINGNFTTSTAFGVRFDVNGGGTLNLGTNGATSNFNQSINAADVDRGTLKFSANNAIPTLAPTSGGVTLTPELVVGDVATIDLNGTTQTFNAFTATADGTSIITNSNASAATLIVGANNNAVAFGTGGVGTYSITQPAGTINLGKVGTGTANFTGTLGYTGTTTSSGGALNINSVSNSTAAVGDGGTVNFKAGFANNNLLTSVATDNGGLVSFVDGVGTPFNMLNNLSLSMNANSGLELEVGDSGTDKLTTLNAATVNNITTLFIKDIDITSNTTYDLIVDANGGLGALANYQLNLPGYSGSTLTVTSNLVQLNAGALITSDVYWNNGTGQGGTLTQAWNTVDGTTNNINFSGLVDGLTALQTSDNLPGKGQKVIFQADNLTGGAPLATTLEQSFTINALEFRPSNTAADTSRTITIAPGAVSSNSLTVKPSLATDGINLQTDAAGTVTISAPFVAGTDQTWTVETAPIEFVGGIITGTTNVQVANTSNLRPGMTVTGTGIVAGTTISAIVDSTNFTLSAAASNATVNVLVARQLNMSGALTGAGDVVKAGAGKVVLSGANGNLTGTYTNNAGITQVDTLSALGGQVGVPGSGTDITVSGGSFYYQNTTSGTFVNDITLNGGTLSAGGTNQTYNGSINVASNSFVNLRNQAASATFTTTGRIITLSGVVSGSGSLTVDSVTTVSGGNQLTGNLTINNAGNTWNGDLNFNRGTVILTNSASPNFSANNLNFNTFGRLQLQGPNGSTLTRTGTLNYGAGAIGEFSVDNTGTVVDTNYTVNQAGAVTLGSGGTGGSARLFVADAFSKLTISGGLTLEGNSSISVGGDATAVVTVDGAITDGANSYSLAINDDAGGWGTTNRALRLNNANTYDGGTTLAEGTLQLGNKDALGTGALTVSGASTIQATTDLSGANSVGNATTLNASVTVSGTNSLELSGTFTATGADANRTLTNSLTGPAALTLSGPVSLGAAANTAARTFTVTGAGATTISGVVADGSAFANNLTKTGAGTLTLSNMNTYTGTTTLSTNSGGTNGVILATATNALGTGAVTSVFNTGALTGQIQLSGGITLGNSSFTTSGFGSDGTVSGVIRSISGANVISGPVNMTGGGGPSTYRADSGSSLTFGGNVGAVGGNLDRIVNLVGGGDFVFNGVIQNFNDTNVAGTTGLNSSNTGTTTLNGLNTYTRATTVGLGSTLIAGSTQAFGVGSATTVNGTLRLNGNSNSIGSLAGANTGTVENESAADATLTTTTATNTTFSGLIQDGTLAGKLGLTKNGAGTLTLSGVNMHSGITTINAGAISISVDSNLGAAPGAPTIGQLTLNGGSLQTTATTALDVNRGIELGAAGGTLAPATGTTLTVAGEISGVGGLTVNGVGGNLVLSGTTANTYTGVTTVTGGTLELNKTPGVNATGPGSGSKAIVDLVINGGTVKMLANHQFGDLVNIHLNSGTFNRNGRSDTIYNFVNNGGTYLSGRGGTWTVTDPDWLGGSSDILGTDVYGILNVAGGTNTIHGDELSGFGAGSVTVGAGGLNFSGTASPTITVSSDDTAAGSLILNGNVTFTGASGTAQILQGNQLTDAGGPGPWTDTLALGANLGTLDLGAVDRTFTIADGSSAVDMRVTTVITNGELTKAGAGTLEVTGANTYAGGTTVDAGTLLVNNVTGSGTGTGVVTVQTGATLGGTGTVAGNTTIDGTHAAGQVGGAGAQTFTNNLTYSSDGVIVATVDWDLVNNTVTGGDSINVGGTLDFNNTTTLSLDFGTTAGGSTVDWSDTFWTTDKIGTSGWLIYNGATSLDGFANLSIGGSLLDAQGDLLSSVHSTAAFSVFQSGNNVYLNYVTAVPEPGTIGVLGLAGLALAAARRRKARKAKAEKDALAQVETV